jgi:hypothetical protein
MLDRIEMHVIDMPRKIRFIAHGVFPKPPLPYTAFAFGNSRGRSAL